MQKISFTVGRFMPFTQGHLNMVLDANEPVIIYRINSSEKEGPIKIKGKLAKKSQIQNAIDYVDSECSTKLTEDEKEILKRPFTNDIIAEELEIVKRNNKNIIDVVYVKNMFDALDRFNAFCYNHKDEYEPHYMMCGDDRVQNYQDTLDKLGKYEDMAIELGSSETLPNIIAGKIETNIGSGRKEGLSGTAVRECIIKKDKATFEKQMPAGVGIMFDKFVEAFDKFIEKLRGDVKEAKNYISLEEYIAENNIVIQLAEQTNISCKHVNCSSILEGAIYDEIAELINKDSVLENFGLFNSCDVISNSICKFLSDEVEQDKKNTGDKNTRYIYTSNIDFFDKIEINLSSESTRCSANIDLTNTKLSDKHNTIKKYVLSGVKLNINSRDDLLNSGKLSGLIQHELTHAYNLYCELLSVYPEYIDSQSNDYKSIINNFVNKTYPDKTIEHQIEQTIYFLEKSEVNAYIAQLHSEVEQLVIDYNNLSDTERNKTSIIKYIFDNSTIYKNYINIFVLTDYLKICDDNFKKYYSNIYNIVCSTDYLNEKVIKTILTKSIKVKKQILKQFPKIIYDKIKESLTRYTFIPTIC